MSSYHKFVKNQETEKEKVGERNHAWYFNANMTKEADTYLVKVKIPKGEGHDFHRHPKMNEILYFLKGKAEQWVEDEKQILQAGDSVYIDPNMVHATFNVGEEDLEFLAILAPASGWEAGTIDEFENFPYSTYR